MEREYRINVEYEDNGTHLITLYKVNIDPRGIAVADFESRTLSGSIDKLGRWLKADMERKPAAAEAAKLRDPGAVMSTIHDRAIHSESRELCLALAKICESLHQWDGARTLRRAAEYLYHEKYVALFRAAADEAHRGGEPLMAKHLGGQAEKAEAR